MPGLEDYLTVKAAAEHLGVCTNTLRNWDRDGKIQVHRHPKNGYRLFLVSDLDAVREEIERTGKHPTGWQRPTRRCNKPR